MVWGASIDPVNQGLPSTAEQIPGLWTGNIGMHGGMAPRECSRELPICKETDMVLQSISSIAGM